MFGYSKLFFIILFTAASGAAVGRHKNNATTVTRSNSVRPADLDLATSITRLLAMLPIKEQLVTALSEPVARAYDTLRPGFKAVGFAYLAYQAITYLLPGMLGSWTDDVSSPRSAAMDYDPVGSSAGLNGGTSGGLGSKPLSEAIGELGVSAMAQSLQALNFTPRSTEIFSTWEQECKRRAFCELGKSLAERTPYFAWILGYFGARISIVGQFGDAFSQGISRPDCSLLYQQCPYLRPTT